jgi:hypothetical protein
MQTPQSEYRTSVRELYMIYVSDCKEKYIKPLTYKAWKEIRGY